MDNTVSLR